jgi:hypothetical protein
MSEEASFRLTGGCQCGAVRYALLQQPDNPHICHCRMCQKAFGSFFAPLTGVPLEKFEITRGELSIFKSSDLVERGFCRNCGTPLSFRFADSDRISVSIGSLDEPEKIEPLHQFGNEARLPWFDKLPGLAGRETTSESDDPPRTAEIAASNHQHPDHDTAAWKPRERES